MLADVNRSLQKVQVVDATRQNLIAPLLCDFLRVASDQAFDVDNPVCDRAHE